MNRAKRVQGSRISGLSARRAGLAEWIRLLTSIQKREISHGLKPAEILLFTTESALPPDGGPGKQVTTTGVGPGNISRWKLIFSKSLSLRNADILGP